MTLPRYKKRDYVWVKNPHRQCMLKFEISRVTEITNQHLVVVNGMEETCPWLSSLPRVDNDGVCYGDISYHTTKIDSSNLNIFSKLSSLGGDHFSIAKDTIRLHC